jgi:hypothetical protein
MATLLTLFLAAGFICAVFGFVFSGLLWLAVLGVVVVTGSIGYGLAKGHFPAGRAVH